MSYTEFEGRLIEVIDFDDVATGERVVEFRDRQQHGEISVVAIVLKEGEPWEAASIMVNSEIGAVSLNFMMWAISFSKEMAQ